MNFIPFLATFGIPEILLLIAAGSAAASTYANYSAAQTQAKQSKLNAQAQADALAAEAAQKANETAVATRRKMEDQRRFRSSQLAAISGQGVQVSGTPLDILANTAVKQQQELQDISYGADTERRSYTYAAQNALAIGAQQASQIKTQANATLLSNLSQMASMASSVPTSKSAAPTKSTNASKK
jgi:hypothetical protein